LQRISLVRAGVTTELASEECRVGIPDTTANTSALDKDYSITDLNMKKHNRVNSTRILSISEGNQDNLIYYTDYDQMWFDEINAIYSWDNYNRYDNKYNKYLDKLFIPLNETWPEGETKEEYYLKLTKGQKIIFSMLIFEGQICNGGVSQFFMNYPENSLPVLEGLEELQLEQLKHGYEKCFQEFCGSARSLEALRDAFKINETESKDKWLSFSEDDYYVISGEKFEEYFYTDECRKLFHKAMVDYIDNNLYLFVKK
jgi:hypothetical protein